MIKPQDVLGFWFADANRPYWFEKSPQFDARVRDILGPAHERAAEGGLENWKDGPDSCLALVLLLDQVPRNLWRGTPRAFATDPQALAVAKLAVERGFDADFDADRRAFLYLPFEHSEDLADQRLSVELFRERIGPGVYLDYADQHLKIIERFGRFPHRNAVLGRRSTDEELEFLKQPGSSF